MLNNLFPDISILQKSWLWNIVLLDTMDDVKQLDTILQSHRTSIAEGSGSI